MGDKKKFKAALTVIKAELFDKYIEALREAAEPKDIKILKDRIHEAAGCIEQLDSIIAEMEWIKNGRTFQNN